jgi:hypothetical protein
MTSNNEGTDQGETSPASAPYPAPPGTSQYSGAASYSFPSTDYTPIPDHDLLGGQGYPQPMQHDIAQQLREATQNEDATRNAQAGMRIHTNGNGMPGMAPPQAANAPVFSPAQRSSVDETPDGGTPTDKKNKAKASQACDECRRKKVRSVIQRQSRRRLMIIQTKCITTTGPDGMLSTCNSCAKSGLDCQYSRQPLKRGPNKGYGLSLAVIAERGLTLLQIHQRPCRSCAADGEYGRTTWLPCLVRSRHAEWHERYGR